MLHVDFLTVFIAAIVYMVISLAWYSPFLFGNMWLRLSKLESKDVRNKPLAIFCNFIIALILSYFISLIEIFLDVTSFWDGVIAGFIIYLGFVFTTQFTKVIWVKKTFKLFLLDNLCWLLSIMVMGGILAG